MFQALCFVVLAAFVAFGATLFMASNSMPGQAPVIAAEPATLPVDAEQAGTSKNRVSTKKTPSRRKNAGPSTSSSVSPLPLPRPASDPRPLQ